MQFSIILPCYNVEKYITKCLKSLFINNLANSEIILINDGSTDNTLKVVESFLSETCKFIGGEEYQKGSTSIILHTQTNAGVSAARNTGIRFSKGEYIIFVDPDDTVEPDLIDTVFRTIAMRDVDLVFYGFTRSYYDEFGNLTWNENVLPMEEYNCDNNDLLFEKLFSRYIGYSKSDIDEWANSGISLLKMREWGACWRIAYKRSLLVKNKLYFNERIKVNEDSMFNAEVIIYASSCLTINRCLYNYNIRQSGALTSRNSDILTNKSILFSERRRLVGKACEEGHCVDERCYAGSIVLGIIEIFTKTSILEWKSIKKLIKQKHIRKSISCIDFNKNIKFSICLLFMKLRCEYILLILVRIASLFGFL